MLSLDELRRAALEARDKAKAGEDVRAAVAIRHAKTAISAHIHAVPMARGGLATSDLPTPEVTLWTNVLGTREAPFLPTDVERLRTEMPAGFSVEAVKVHAVMCDCDQDHGCIDAVRVTWTWE